MTPEELAAIRFRVAETANTILGSVTVVYRDRQQLLSLVDELQTINAAMLNELQSIRATLAERLTT